MSLADDLPLHPAVERDLELDRPDRLERRRGKGRRGKGRGRGRGQRGRRRPGASRPPSAPVTTTPTTPTPTSPGSPGPGDGGLLSPADLHLVRRFSYGVTPDLAAQVVSRGGAGAWLEWQLRPDLVADPRADELAGWWPSLARTPQDLWDRERDGPEGGWLVMACYQRWLLNRRLRTQRQVAERMTDFWLAHLHVPVLHDGVFTHRVDYDRVVRSHALGSFSDLLQAAVVHPAMGIYLDNAVSTAAHPNENLGRELLELHTVGRGAYSEDDVKASSRLLTGYRVDVWTTFAARYSPADHATGPVRVMDFEHPNADPDGRAAVAAYLDHLAHHPRTAERIARKLATAFVSDTPSTALVSRLAQVYLDAGTAIVPVLRALVASAEFAGASGAKVRDPAEDVVATYRALGVQVDPPGSATSEAAANMIGWQSLSVGAAPCGWPRPDGPPADAASWSSPARMLASFALHWEVSGGWWPAQGVTYRTTAQWMPAEPTRFDDLVDHLCRQVLGRTAPADLLVACAAVVGAAPDTVVTTATPGLADGVQRLLATILDSPHHLCR